MLRVGWVGISLAVAGCLQAASYQGSGPAAAPSPIPSHQAVPVSSHQALLNSYCVTCHNEALNTAGLMLDRANVERVSDDAAAWENVVRKLRARSMPPDGMPRPGEADYDSLATYLETELDAAAALRPNPGRLGIQRLNRAEYTNAVRDLLAIEIDGESLLPADDSGYGFDNIGDVLSVSPLLLERYMAAARTISRRAIGDPGLRPTEETYVISRYLVQDSRMSEDLPFGSRGGIAIRHFFPLDGEYVIKIFLKKSYEGNYRTLGLSDKPYRLDVRLDGDRIKRFQIAAEPEGESASPADSKGDFEQVTVTLTTGDVLEVRTPIQAGPHVVGIAFLDDYVSKLEGAPREIVIARTDEEGEGPALGSVVIGGPYVAKGPGETPSRRRIFVCKPTGSADEKPCAREILSVLARRAYRRPISDADMPDLLAPFDAGRSEGGFEAGIQMALQRVLVSPEFLFRVERDPTGVAPDTAYPVSDIQLASRLSFFLWSSIPDDQLRNLAEQGKLNNPVVLEQQVRRMLADPRSRALVANFAGQWLYLRNMQTVMPDKKEFPEFDENLREALVRETELFFESMLREDRGVFELLDAPYTFLNERLGRHYGIPNIYGSHFRRVNLDDERRRGLLGQGSILTVTSYANRTSPTLRGKFVLENILGAPPPPPPANVPSLKDRNESGKMLSVRKQLEEHRRNPVCAACHALMDPLGFALENFDALGKWRTVSGVTNVPIDASGVLPDGTQFNGPAELRQILLSRREEFVGVVAEKLLTYALGRGLEYYDQPAVRKIIMEAAPDYHWSSMILGIVKSPPFQMRRSQPE